MAIVLLVLMCGLQAQPADSSATRQVDLLWNVKIPMRDVASLRPTILPRFK